MPQSPWMGESGDVAQGCAAISKRLMRLEMVQST
jgi:hypothetical protein